MEGRMYMQVLSSSMCEKQQFSSFGHPRIISLLVKLPFHMTSIETKSMAGGGCRVIFCLFVSLFVFSGMILSQQVSQLSSKIAGTQECRKPEVKPKNQGDVSGLGSESSRYKTMNYVSEDTTE